MPSYVFRAAALVALVLTRFHGAFAQCDLQATISPSVEDGGGGSNDADLVGGVGVIDKITKIKILTGYTDIFNSLFTVRQICTTYRFKDAAAMGAATREICHGQGGSEEGSIIFGDGEYLRRVEFLGGRFIDNIRFQKTDGSWSNRWGGKLAQNHNTALEAPNSVIKSLLVTVGDIPSHIDVMFEANRIYKVWQLDPDFTESFAPKVTNTTTPKATETNNNLDGSILRSYTVTFREKVVTTETTTVTKSEQFDAEVSYTASAGFNVGVVSASAELSLTLGTSFSLTEGTEKSVSFEKEVVREYEIAAPPFTLVTAVVSWEEVEYEYDWTAPVLCSYTHDPSKEYPGESFQGTMAGTQTFPMGYVVFYEETAPGTTPTSTGAITAAPTDPGTPPASTATTTGVISGNQAESITSAGAGASPSILWLGTAMAMMSAFILSNE